MKIKVVLCVPWGSKLAVSPRASLSSPLSVYSQKKLAYLIIFSPSYINQLSHMTHARLHHLHPRVCASARRACAKFRLNLIFRLLCFIVTAAAVIQNERATRFVVQIFFINFHTFPIIDSSSSIVISRSKFNRIPPSNVK